MLQAREFLLRLSLCRGLGRISKVRVWKRAQQLRCFDDLPRLVDGCQLSLRSQTALLNNWTSPELDRAVRVNQAQPHLTIDDPAYPASLREIFCPPLVLFYAGDLSLLSGRGWGLWAPGTRRPMGWGSCVAFSPRLSSTAWWWSAAWPGELMG